MASQVVSPDFILSHGQSLFEKPHSIDGNNTIDTQELSHLLLALCNNVNANSRLSILDQLLIIIRHTKTHIPSAELLNLFQCLNLSLLDDNWEVRHRGITIVTELVPHYSCDIDLYMNEVLQTLISLLGEKKIVVCQAAIDCLHRYMKNTKKFEIAVEALVHYGLQNKSVEVQHECCCVLPSLLSSKFANENLTNLVLELTKKLLSINKSVSSAAFKTLQSIENLVGSIGFNKYLDDLPHSLSKCYRGLVNHSLMHKLDVRADAEAFDNENVVKKPPTVTAEELSENNGSMVFGVVPLAIMQQLEQNDDFRKRAQAVEELLACINDLNQLTQLKPHLEYFFTFLHSLLDDANFKIITVTLEILIEVVNRLGISVKPHVEQITLIMSKRLGDNKIVVRQGIMKLGMLLMQILTPQDVLDCMSENVSNRNSRVRQETLNLIIGALLTFPSVDFDLVRICDTVAPCLVDSKRQVRHAALDCMAMLAQYLGADKLEPLVHAVQCVEVNLNAHGVLKAVQARLSRRQLPRLNQDGLVDYATCTPSSATQRCLPSRSSAKGFNLGADDVWILAATSLMNSARSRPPPTELMDVEADSTTLASTPLTMGATERRKSSAGALISKAKLPWTDYQEREQTNHTIESRQQSFSAGIHLHKTSSTVFKSKNQEELNQEPIPPSWSASDRKPSSAAENHTRFNYSLSGFNGVNRINDNKLRDEYSPIPLKPQLVRSAGKRQNRLPVPPIALRDDMLNQVDSGFASTASTRTNSHMESARLNMENSEKDMADSLFTIRSSASKKRALKVFEHAERKTKYSSDDDEDEDEKIFQLNNNATTTHALDSNNAAGFVENHVESKDIVERSNFNPYRGATFKDNPLYDGKIIGRGYIDETLEVKWSPNSESNSRNIDATVNRVCTYDGFVKNRLPLRKAVAKAVELPNHQHWTSSQQQMPRPILFFQLPKWDDAHGETLLQNKTFERLSLQTQHVKFNNQVIDKGTVNSSLSQNSENKHRVAQNHGAADSPPSGIVGIGLVTLTDDEEEIQSQSINISRGLQERLSSKRQLQVEEKLRKLKNDQVDDDVQKVEKRRLNDEISHDSLKLEIHVANIGSKPPAPPSGSAASRKTHDNVQHLPPSYRSAASTNADSERDSTKNPDKVLVGAILAIQNEDWERKCDGLNKVRFLADHHPDILARDLHNVVININREMKNLRSMVARTAIQCLAHLFRTMRRQMDSHIDQVVKVLLAKAGESNVFIREDVNAALEEMVKHLTPQRALGALIAGGAQHKNILTRRVTAQYLCDICELLGPGKLLSGVKDITDKVIVVAVQLTSDANPETRYIGRKIIYNLMVHADFERICQHHVSANSWRSVQSIIDNLKTKGLGEMPSSAPSAGLRRADSLTRVNDATATETVAERTNTPSSHSAPSSGKSMGAGASRAIFGHEALERVKHLTDKLTSKDWVVKLNGINEFVDVCESNPEFVATHIVKFFDAFAPRLKDANNKVALHALASLHSIMPIVSDHLPKVINLLVQSVACNNNLANLNADIRRASGDLLNAFVKHVDPSVLLQPFVQACTLMNKNNKIDMINLITQLCEILLKQHKLRLVTIQVEPELWRLLTGFASGNYVANDMVTCQAYVINLVHLLHSYSGNELLQRAKQANASPRMLQLLQDIINRPS